MSRDDASQRPSRVTVLAAVVVVVATTTAAASRPHAVKATLTNNPTGTMAPLANQIPTNHHSIGNLQLEES
jgi:alkanesulfonate monooxygenase SsuD/methylene tetrahydromethanopterin reductase-like flavin-dependent oxidoreductase (luciferase family)